MSERPRSSLHRSSGAPPKSAVVLGATGHIGSAVVRELLSRGVRVTAATRQRQVTANLAGLSISLAPGDAEDPARIDQWISGHDLVVDAAVPYPIWMFRPSGRAEVDPHAYAQQRTDRILEIVRRRGATLALVGSFTTLPHPGDARGEMEPGVLRRSHPYFMVKDTVESMALSAAKDGLKIALVNPSAFLGPWDGKPRDTAFLPALLNGEMPMTTSRVVSFVDVRDVATALVNAVWTGRYGEKLPLAGHDIPIDDLAKKACSIYGVSPPKLRGSTRIGAALAYWSEAAFGAVGKRPPVSALSMLLVRYAYPMAPISALSALGVTPRPLDETLRDSIRWYSQTGYLK